MILSVCITTIYTCFLYVLCVNDTNHDVRNCLVKFDWLYNKENTSFLFLLKDLLRPMGVIEVSYGCNRTPSEEPGVNGSYSRGVARIF